MNNISFYIGFISLFIITIIILYLKILKTICKSCNHKHHNDDECIDKKDRTKIALCICNHEHHKSQCIIQVSYMVDNYVSREVSEQVIDHYETSQELVQKRTSNPIHRSRDTTYTERISKPYQSYDYTTSYYSDGSRYTSSQPRVAYRDEYVTKTKTEWYWDEIEYTTSEWKDVQVPIYGTKMVTKQVNEPIQKWKECGCDNCKCGKLCLKIIDCDCSKCLCNWCSNKKYCVLLITEVLLFCTWMAYIKENTYLVIINLEISILVTITSFRDDLWSFTRFFASLFWTLILILMSCVFKYLYSILPDIIIMSSLFLYPLTALCILFFTNKDDKDHDIFSKIKYYTLVIGIFLPCWTFPITFTIWRWELFNDTIVEEEATLIKLFAVWYLIRLGMTLLPFLPIIFPAMFFSN